MESIVLCFLLRNPNSLIMQFLKCSISLKNMRHPGSATFLSAIPNDVKTPVDRNVYPTGAFSCSIDVHGQSRNADNLLKQFNLT